MPESGKSRLKSAFFALFGSSFRTAKVEELKPTITARYKVKDISLFGSFARGEQVENSDIDLLTEFEDNADLFDMIGLELYLEDMFKRAVDIVPKKALRSELRETVLQQVVAI